MPNIQTLTGYTRVGINFTARASLDLSSPVDVIRDENLTNWTFGSGVNQADDLCGDVRTLATGASDVFDLTNVGINSAFGVGVSLSQLKAFSVRNLSVTNTLVLSGANGETSPIGDVMFGDDADSVKIKPGGRLYLEAPDANGYDVSGGKSEIKITHGAQDANSLQYEIILMGSRP